MYGIYAKNKSISTEKSKKNPNTGYNEEHGMIGCRIAPPLRSGNDRSAGCEVRGYRDFFFM